MADLERQVHQATLEERALELVRHAHAGQVDKQGRDYVEHHLLPIAALLRPFGPLAYVSGLLHDIVEDTSMTGKQLSQLGFPTIVVEAVEAVSRQADESYPQLIERAAAHPLGRLVKLADNWHNLSTVDSLPEADALRLRQRYQSAREVLERALS